MPKDFILRSRFGGSYFFVRLYILNTACMAE